MAKKEESKDLLENAEVIQEKIVGVEHWVEQNPKLIIGVVAALVLSVGGYFGWRYFIDNQEAQAQKEMFQAVHYFEADRLNLVLNGDVNYIGFKQLIDEYGETTVSK